MTTIDTSSPGVAMIAAERERQVSEKGWTAQRDDARGEGDLAVFAAMLLSATLGGSGPEDLDFPDDETDWMTGAVEHALGKWEQPVDRLRIVGALIAAEIDRLLRAEGEASHA